MAKHTEHLQLRLTAEQKIMLQKAAEISGMPMSDYVRARLFPGARDRFQACVRQVAQQHHRREALAELNGLLADLSILDFPEAVSEPPSAELSELDGNYIAAMVDVAAHQKGLRSPAWTSAYRGLKTPHFASPLKSHRLHLLLSSPAPFRARGIFIDATIGDRV